MASAMGSRRRFSQLRQGERARVVAFFGEFDHVQRLAEMGLVEGTEFRVLKVAPLGDPIEIDVRGSRVCLRKSEADGLEIVLID